jgi:hypothetical protein
MLCCGPHCSSLTSPAVDQAEEPHAVVPLALSSGSQMDYRLAWSWEGAVWQEQDQAYLFATDLGYSIGVQAMYMGSGIIELVPCSQNSEASNTTPTSLTDRLWNNVRPVMGTRSAWANHAYNNDESILSQAIVENSFSQSFKEFGIATASGSSYCKAHILTAPLNQTSEDDFWMKRWSFYWRGWYQLPGEEQRTEVEVATNLGTGALHDLTAETGTEIAIKTATGESLDAVLTFRRYPALSLDGVAIEQLSNSELAFAMQQGIGHHTIVSYQTTTKESH